MNYDQRAVGGEVTVPAAMQAYTSIRPPGSLAPPGRERVKLCARAKCQFSA